jgi:hypothetical protein
MMTKRIRPSRLPTRLLLPRTARFLAAGFAAFMASVPAAQAGTVKGTVKLPEVARSTRAFHGYWRVENGVVPVQTSGGVKAETVVVLDKVKGSKGPLPARTVTIDLQALDARPRLVVAGPGSVVEIKNSGKVRHELSTPDTPKVMPLETLSPGAPPRRQRFDAPGGYVIRDSEYPHIMISVIIVDSPYYAAVDEKGSFQIANVPDGTVTLKVWTRGKWVAEQEIDAGSKDDVHIKVTSIHEKESKPATE